MATWHDSIEAYEVHQSRRENWNDRNPNVVVSLYVASASADQFVRELLLERSFYPLNTGQALACLRVMDAQVVQDSSCYVPDANNESMESGWYKIVTLTFATDIREEAEICGQSVLVTERMSPHTEFISLDYSKFVWQDGKALTSPEQGPSLLVPTFKVNMTIERILLDLEGSGSGYDCDDKLLTISGCVNSSARRFHTMPRSFRAETILANVENFGRSIQYFTSGSGGECQWWFTVNLTFTVRQNISPWAGATDSDNATWNKWYRVDYDGSGNTKSGWYELYYKPKGDGVAPSEKATIYPINADVDDFLVAG